jgi:8-oxo-dGTP diphosphatase
MKHIKNVGAKYLEHRQVKVGVGLLLWKDSKVALIKRAGVYGTSTWAPPGGHVEFGESAIEAARRETTEEVGIEVKNLTILGFTEDFTPEYNTHYITIWVQGDWKSGELKAVDEEFTESGFFDMGSLPNPLFVPFKNLIDGKLLPKDS